MGIVKVPIPADTPNRYIAVTISRAVETKRINRLCRFIAYFKGRIMNRESKEKIISVIP
jgi:hypothetical protein